MAVDIKQLFDSEVGERLARHPGASKPSARYQFVITGEGDGQWLIDTKGSEPKAEHGRPGGADVTITVSAEDFERLYDRPEYSQQLFFVGKLKTVGDPMLAMKAFSLLKD
ncbi:SCP2 sterol-binding domain-containing protein [Streptomyces rimosus]|uniref:SCP2 sterol-binding domain-containing protein n=1 Tax=Streptomyces rimosus TaxID=1927 RepID=UPI0031D93380